MPDSYNTVSPTSIIIPPRSERQRQMVPIDDDFKRSITKRIINPIVVNFVDGKYVLVAGERRLTAALELGLHTVPIRRFDDLTPEEAKIIELEENIKRVDLPWRDTVRAIGDLHQMFLTTNSSWRGLDTAREIAASESYVSNVLKIYAVLDSPDLANATGVTNAYTILLRKAERRAEGIVQGILVAGATAFDSEGVGGRGDEEVRDEGHGYHRTDYEGNVLNKVSHGSDVARRDDIRLGHGESGKESSDSRVEQSTVHNDVGSGILNVKSIQENSSAQKPNPQQPHPRQPVLCTNFIDFAAQYSGPKFNFIHCDFPYGTYKGDDSSGTYVVNEFYENRPDTYWALLKALTINLYRLMSYSSHMMFWFDMKFYTETVRQLSETGLFVHPHPLIWHKTAGGVMPGNSVSHPRRTYDTALLCTRGNRPFVKPGSCSYAAPPVYSKMHPSQKPEPMLRFFMSMFVDGNTIMLDPTCGSASALRAAEDLGAKLVLGLELDADNAKAANSATLSARVLRAAGK